jgi:hypothetical protein
MFPIPLYLFPILLYQFSIPLYLFPNSPISVLDSPVSVPSCPQALPFPNAYPKLAVDSPLISAPRFSSKALLPCPNAYVSASIHIDFFFIFCTSMPAENSPDSTVAEQDSSAFLTLLTVGHLSTSRQGSGPSLSESEIQKKR